MQQLMNQNTTFNLQLRGNAYAADVMANANSLDEGLDTIAKSSWGPYTLPYQKDMRDIIKLKAETEQAYTKAGAETLTAQNSGLQNLLHTILPNMYTGVAAGYTTEQLNDQYQKLRTSGLAVIPERFRTATAYGLDKWWEAMHAGITPDTPADQQASIVTKNMISSFPAANIGEKEAASLVGTPHEYVGADGYRHIGLILPPQLGRRFVETDVIPEGIPPGLRSPGQTIGGGWDPRTPLPKYTPEDLGPRGPLGPGGPMGPSGEGSGGSLAPGGAMDLSAGGSGGSTNPLMPPTILPGYRNPNAIPPVPTPAVPTLPPAPKPPMEFSYAGDERPMYNPSAAIRPFLPGHYDVQGAWNFDKAAQKQVDDAQEAFVKGAESAEAAQNTKAEVHYMNSEFDHLKGTVLVPGYAGEIRTRLSMAYNTALDWLKTQDPTFDPAQYKVSEQSTAAAQGILKSAIRLGYSYTKLSFGAQREAAQTINTSLKAVPGLENSYYAGKLLLSMVESGADRELDLRNFQNVWQADPANHGSLAGSVDEFNRQHPATGYAEKVLRRFGLDEQGFTNGAAINKAHADGLIDAPTAEAARMKLWDREHPRPPKGATPSGVAPSPAGTIPGPDIGIPP
jgi:hypothetical protein